MIMKLWIARDEEGFIAIYQEKPVYRHGEWYGGLYIFLKKEIYPEVTFENSPQEVELKLIK